MLRATILVTVLAAVAAGQAKKTWKPPLTSDGQPDLQGVWTNATITPFERPAQLASKAFLTEKEAAELEKQSAEDRPKGGTE